MPRECKSLLFQTRIIRLLTKKGYFANTSALKKI